MAHEIAKGKDGKDAFVSSGGQVPWHKLGMVLPQDYLTSEECIKYAGLDYQIEKTPVCISVGGQNIEVPGQYATYRADTNYPFGVVGERYTIVQNREAFTFFDAIVGEGKAIYETAGALFEGRQIFVTAKLPKHIRVGKNDMTDMYVVLKMSHDGKGAIKAMITPIRVVCNNTLRMAIKAASNTVSVKHLSNVHASIREAHKFLDIANKYTEIAQQAANELSKIKISDKKVDDLLMKIFPGTIDTETGELSTRAQNIHNAVLESYHTGPGQKAIVGTGWGLYNGITHYLSHVKTYKNESQMMESVLETTTNDVAQMAFDLILN